MRFIDENGVTVAKATSSYIPNVNDVIVASNGTKYTVRYNEYFIDDDLGRNPHFYEIRCHVTAEKIEPK